jgi:hypothetical protein
MSPVLIPKTLFKRDFADEIKDLEMGRISCVLQMNST